MSSSSHQFQISDVAVIVAAKNEEKNIKSCIESILKSTQGRTEIIVVNDGSTDQTGAILESFGTSVFVITTEGEGPSKARNRVLHMTLKPYVAFVDADASVDSKWLTSLIQELNGKDMQYVSVGGIQQMHPQGGTWDLFHASFLECMGFASDYLHTSQKIKEVKHNPTCNVLYKKDEVLKMGGFDPNLWPCEDLDLDLRLRKAGKKLLYTPSAIIYHHRPNSFMGFMNMMFRYGFGHAQIVKKHGISQKIHWMPIIIVLTLGFVFWEATHKWLISFGFTKYIIIYAFLVIRSKSLIRALIYGFYLIPSMTFWNLGFFAGLFQKMKITAK